MKRETAPTSDSAQSILAWRSKDSVESAGSSQSEAQPGSGCNAIPGAAQSGGSRCPARAQAPNKRETMRGERWRGRDEARENWDNNMGLGEVREVSMSRIRRKVRRNIVKRDVFFCGKNR